MSYLHNILGNLLLRNNCVILPSLGGFVANHIPAAIDGKKGVISPPKKALTFNVNLINNDGLIIHYVANKYDFTYEDARKIVETEIREIKTKLTAGKRVTFDNVGFLYLNQAGKIAFEQERFFNLLLSSYGMGKVHFEAFEEEKESIPTLVPTAPIIELEKEKPIHRENETLESKQASVFTPAKEKEQVENTPVKEEKSVVIPLQKEEQPKKKRRALTVLKYAAAIALIPLVFYSFWIPMKTDVLESGIIFREDFNPFYQPDKNRYSNRENAVDIEIVEPSFSSAIQSIEKNLKEDIAVFNYPFDEDVFIPVKRKAVEENREINESTVEKQVVSTGNLHLIVGCFAENKNAKELIDNLKSQGFQAYEVDVKGGLHRISAGNCENQGEVNALRTQLNQLNMSSWVLKK